MSLTPFETDSHPLAGYIREMQARMGLDQWELDVEDVVAPEGFVARMSTLTEAHVATVELQPSWRSETPEELRRTVTHELLHLHMKPLDHQLVHLEDLLGKPTFSVFIGNYRQWNEKTIEQIARFWCRTLPLPDESLLTG